MKRNSKAALIVAAVIALVVAMPLLMNQAHSESHWEDGHMMDFGGWGWLMMLMMIVFWGLIVWAVIWAIGAFTHSDGKRDDSAVEFLRRRYAAGEISREEFEAKRGHLS